MIPRLYEYNETNFSSFGLGDLPDALSCLITEERNGIFELVLTYPAKGTNVENLVGERIIKAKADDYREPQLFRIYGIKKTMNGNKNTITVNAQHISYDMSNMVTRLGKETPGTYSVRLSAIISAVNGKTINGNVFYFAVNGFDTNRAADFELKKPWSYRELIGANDNSVLSKWGGELEFNNFTTTLHASRGADRGVSIEYGKNLLGLDHTHDLTAAYNEIVGFYKHSYKQSTSSVEYVLQSDVKTIPNSSVRTKKTLLLDCNSAGLEIGENYIGYEAQVFLNSFVRDYADAHPELGYNVPSLSVSFYQDPQLLDQIRLCDTVTIKNDILGIDEKLKAVSVVYDTLSEKFVDIKLGRAPKQIVSTYGLGKSILETIRDWFH